LHHPASLLGPHGKGIIEGLREVVARGWVVKLGVSVYAPDQLSSLPQEFKPAIVQIPFNLFDQRVLADGWLARMHDSGVEVHLRSVFLQGLLLMAPNERPQWTEKWHFEFSALDQWLRHSRQSPLEACIGAAMSLPLISRIVVGVDSSSHLTDLFRAASLPQNEFPFVLAATDSNLLNPSNWPVGPF
jgi:aryl-alcohol dehydrogenase-like predicted oxidoreductase